MPKAVSKGIVLRRKSRGILRCNSGGARQFLQESDRALPGRDTGNACLHRSKQHQEKRRGGRGPQALHRGRQRVRFHWLIVSIMGGVNFRFCKKKNPLIARSVSCFPLTLVQLVRVFLVVIFPFFPSLRIFCSCLFSGGQQRFDYSVGFGSFGVGLLCYSMYGVLQTPVCPCYNVTPEEAQQF